MKPLSQYFSIFAAFFTLSTPSFANESPPDPSFIGAKWFFLGDSQTIGRAKQEHTKSHAIAFYRIWEATFGENVTQTVNGVSGRTMKQTRTYFIDNAKKNSSWVHFQESGNQLSDNGSQNTAKKFVNQFESLVRAINKLSPNAKISTETAYSFEAEKMKGRDWKKYNIALYKSVVKLRSEGITVYVANVDNNIKNLVTAKRKELGVDGGQQAVWGGPSNELKRHFTGLGNFMIALSIYEALGFDLDKLNFRLIPGNEVSQADIELCLAVIERHRSIHTKRRTYR